MPEALLAVPVLGDILGAIGTAGAGIGSALGTAGAGIGSALGGAEAVGAAGAGLGEAAAASAPLDLLSFGTAAGSAIPEALGSIVPATGALASGLATEPAFAGGLAGAFAPGLDTGASTLGILSGGGASPLDTAAYPSGPVGAPSGGGTSALDNIATGATPSGSPIGTTTAAPASTGAGAVSPPAGVNAPVDLTSAAPTTGGAATTGATAPAAGGAAPSSIFDKLLGGATNSITKNPIGTALAAGGLGYNIMQGQKQSAAVSALESQAASQAATGNTLQSYLQNGTLPPAVQQQLNQATASARARILANYANTPGGADPSKNSALAQELNNLEIQAIASASQVEQQLMQSGIQASGLASNTLTTLANIDQAQSAKVGQSIANFAAALGGGGGTTIKLQA